MVSANGLIVGKILLAVTGVGLVGYLGWVGWKWVQPKLTGVKTWAQGLWSKITDPFGLKKALKPSVSNSSSSNANTLPNSTTYVQGLLANNAPEALKTIQNFTNQGSLMIGNAVKQVGSTVSNISAGGQKLISDIVAAKPITNAFNAITSNPVVKNATDAVTNFGSNLLKGITSFKLPWVK